MSFRIHIVEDEENLNQLLVTYLQNEGWEVTSFLNGTSAREYIHTSPHLWILDIMLPDIDGYTLIKNIKEVTPDVPVIFISARDKDFDRVLGLELGSSDYLAKPFLPRELVIRCQKLLELTYGSSSQGREKPSSYDHVQVGPYAINKDIREVKDGEKGLGLTSKEFDLLLLFVEHPGHAFSREDVLNTVWGRDYFGSDRVVDDLVRRIRKKMPEMRLETIYGFGYRLMKS
ncbi:response regulator transcription factor [Aureibacillus halotolerans]|uniref:Two-component system response regulator CssR n=1 Tax=Aureibacillus halotolerans TaxID=1508390 RepID=A0A4V3D4N7_9BACI|nr:response regulator transcription factor [Aureibacillus halotolerans]TDQ36747.1 two-component system response regulator CssR [Aureibacillus halotolerans]